MEELLQLSLEEFAGLVGSNVKRKVKRSVDEKFVKTVYAAHEQKKQGKEPKILRTHLRDMFIMPQMVGLKLGIHNGKEFQIVEIIPAMLGHRLGELALTRKRLSHGKAGIGATRSSTAIATRK